MFQMKERKIERNSVTQMEAKIISYIKKWMNVEEKLKDRLS